jgi:membrane protein required for colicin V production
MNWIDWLLIIFLLISVVNGFREGMVRIGIGIVALIAGFFLASWFGGMAAGTLLPFIHSKPVASILGYFLVFCGVLIAGALIASLIVRMLKLIGLTWMDRLLGGAFGILRGFVVVSVVAMVVTALAPKWLPAAVHDSTIAPYVLRASSVLTALTPFDIRDGFEKAYKEIRKLRE